MTDPFDFFATSYRHRVPFTEERPDGEGGTRLVEGYMECSLPAEATPEQVKAAEQSMWDAHEQVRAFQAQSEEEKLKHYLRIATDALTKILRSPRTDVRDWDAEPTKEVVHNLRKQITDHICGADLALIQIPTNLRSQKNDS